MSSSGAGGTGDKDVSVPELIFKLCNHLAKNRPDITSKLYQLSSNFIHHSSGMISTSDEQIIIDEMTQFASQTSKYNIEKLNLLYSAIKDSSVLHHKTAVLSFLLNIAKMTSYKESSSWHLSQECSKDFTSARSSRSYININTAQSNSRESLSINKRVSSSQVPMFESKTNASSTSTALWSRQDIGASISKTVANTSLVSETDLIQDVLYTFLGIEGKYLKKEPAGLGFTVDPREGKSIILNQKVMISRLTGISFLHNCIKQYCDRNDKQGGILCHALISILRDELSEYYGTVALLQASMKKQNCVDHPDLTLRRLVYLVQDHQKRFEWLAYIVEECTDKKGGALVSAIHGFSQHGSKIVQEVSEKILTAVCKPLYIMLSRWLLDGEIDDPCKEFFIEARTISTAERLWYDKYTVRKSMVPSFMTMDQAGKILATGKSINFLRQICKDSGQLPGRESLQKVFRTTKADALFAPEQSLEFHATLENVYRETSLRVLDLLKNKFKLLEHLHALRRYLLLGQGDFIRHLLELLAPELNKPAQDIYSHTLSAILESAVRVTNAQFEDEDILQRLNVSFMGHSRGDVGWDVFSLVYFVDGPVSTIFQPTMTTYQSLFGALWKAKRMELALANMRKQQITISKLFKHDHKELPRVMHIFHLLTSDMIHFLHQIQYYFLFEVLECSWAEMLTKVSQAETLDDIIIAHSTFLESVKSGVLLDESSKYLFSQLMTIYHFVLNLENHQESLYKAASNEHEALLEYKQKIDSHEDFGITKEYELKVNERKAKFCHFLNSVKSTVKCLAQSYKSFVKTYLKCLSSSANMNLQLLSVRLSFNDYYSAT